MRRKVRRTLARILRGSSDANIAFDDLRNLLKSLGFAERIRGSHHIFSREDVAEILNLQPKGSSAKVYQVRQVRGLILSYGLVSESDRSENKGTDSSTEDTRDDE